MQAPITVFDHIRKQIVILPTGRGGDKRVSELLEAQRTQVATSGKPST